MYAVSVEGRERVGVGMGWKGCKVRAWGVMCIGGVMGVSHRWHLGGAVCVQGDEVWCIGV